MLVVIVIIAAAIKKAPPERGKGYGVTFPELGSGRLVSDTAREVRSLTKSKAGEPAQGGWNLRRPCVCADPHQCADFRHRENERRDRDAKPPLGREPETLTSARLSQRVRLFGGNHELMRKWRAPGCPPVPLPPNLIGAVLSRRPAPSGRLWQGRGARAAGGEAIGIYR